MLRALYTVKDHVGITVRECLLWGRYLADALASVTSNVEPEDGMKTRIFTPFDVVLRLTFVIEWTVCRT